MWSIRINQELWGLYNDLDIVADIQMMFVCVLRTEYKQLRMVTWERLANTRL